MRNNEGTMSMLLKEAKGYISGQLVLGQSPSRGSRDQSIGISAWLPGGAHHADEDGTAKYLRASVPRRMRLCLPKRGWEKPSIAPRRERSAGRIQRSSAPRRHEVCLGQSRRTGPGLVLATGAKSAHRRSARRYRRGVPPSRFGQTASELPGQGYVTGRKVPSCPSRGHRQ
jgi:hypothetical protein